MASIIIFLKPNIAPPTGFEPATSCFHCSLVAEGRVGDGATERTSPFGWKASLVVSVTVTSSGVADFKSADFSLFVHGGKMPLFCG
jgi:hypothetical protein